MSRFKSLGISALALGLMAAGTAAAQGYGGGHMHGGPGMRDGGGMVAHLTHELDLTADQQSKVQAIVSKYQEGSLGQVMETMRTARTTLMKAIHNPDATDKQVQDAAAVVATADSKMAVEQHHMAVEISSVLTTDQKEKLAQLAEKHGEPGGDGPMLQRDGGF